MKCGRLTLLIDVDLTQRDLCQGFSNAYKIEFGDEVLVPPGGFDQYALHSFFPKLKESEVRDFFYAYPTEIFVNSPTLPKTIEGMKKLYQEYIIKIVTHQFSGLEKYTTEFLEKKDIPYDSLHFTQNKSTIDGDILIDDHPRHLFEAKNSNQIPIKMFRNYNWSWRSVNIPHMLAGYYLIKQIEKMGLEKTKSKIYPFVNEKSLGNHYFPRTA